MRPAAQFAYSLFKHPIVALEVGVEAGISCERVLAEMNIEKLYLVDNYCDNVDYALTTLKKIYQYRNKVCFIIEDSDKAEKDLSPDVMFDFAYIDAAHDYASVKKDIEVWYPRVKPGGVMSGHDYNKKFPYDYSEHVVKAVDEFVKEKGLVLFTANNNAGGLLGGESCWWVVKPGEYKI